MQACSFANSKAVVVLGLSTLESGDRSVRRGSFVSTQAAISEPQLRLLSVTENYLTETYQLSFKAVIKLPPKLRSRKHGGDEIL